MSFRFPGSGVDYESYWKHLNKGAHATTCIPFYRWDNDSLLVVQQDMTETKKIWDFQGEFVDEIEALGPSFFRISETEPDTTSPLQRNILECLYLVF